MNHTQRILLDRASKIRDEERDNATWGGPDPRGDRVAKARLAWAKELETIAAIKEGQDDG